MDNEVSTTLTFEEKLMEKVKKDIGELMSNEDLRKITLKGIEKAIYEPRVDKSSSYRKTIPSLLDEITEKVIREEVAKQINAWFKAPDNAIKIEAAMTSVVQDGIGTAVIKAFNIKLNNEFMSFGHNLIDRIRTGQF